MSTVNISKPWLIALGLLYVISPIDLLPDLVPFVGWFDDLGVVGLVIKALLTSRRALASKD